MWAKRSFLLSFVLFSLVYCGTLQALEPSNGSQVSASVESDLLSDQQVNDLVVELAKLPEEQKQRLIKLLKNFKARSSLQEQAINLFKSRLSEVQLDLSKSQTLVQSQETSIKEQENNLILLSTSLRDERRDHLIVCIEVGVASAAVATLATILLQRR